LQYDTKLFQRIKNKTKPNNVEAKQMRPIYAQEVPVFGNGETIEEFFVKCITRQKEIYSVLLTDSGLLYAKAGRKQEMVWAMTTDMYIPLISIDEVQMDARRNIVRMMQGGKTIFEKEVFQIVPFALQTARDTYIVHPFLGLDEFQVIEKEGKGEIDSKRDFKPPHASEGFSGRCLRITPKGMVLHDSEGIIFSTLKIEDTKIE
jgi:hypothetical protein